MAKERCYKNSVKDCLFNCLTRVLDLIINFFLKDKIYRAIELNTPREIPYLRTFMYYSLFIT